MTFTTGFRVAGRLMRTVLLNGSRVTSRPYTSVRFISSSSQTLSSMQSPPKEASSNSPVLDISPDRENRTPAQLMSRLDMIFNRFESSCHDKERVDQRNYLRTFETFTQTVQKLEDIGPISPENKSSLAVLSSILLRCSGNLMDEVSPKERELIAGSLWEFMKAKQIPADISHYNSLLRVFNENNTEYDPQIIMDEIKSAGLNPDRVTYQRLIRRYCVTGDVTNAMKLLEVMKDLNMELNEGIFASLITGYCQQSSPPPIQEIFDLMKSNNTEPGSKSYTAAIKAQIPKLTKDPQDTTELEKIHSLLMEDDIYFDNSDIIELSAALNPYKANPVVQKILDHLEGSGNFRNIKDQYKLIGALLQVGDYKEASKIYWSNKPSEASMRRKNIGSNYIKLLVHHPSVPSEFCLQECIKLRDMGHNDLALMLLFYFSASCGNLKMVRIVLDELEKEQENVAIQLYWPLIAQSKDDNEIIKVLKEKISKSKSRQDVLDTLTLWIWPRYFENMEHFFEINNKELIFQNDILVTSLVDYAIQNNCLDKAIKFLIDCPNDILKNQLDSNNQEEEFQEYGEDDESEERVKNSTNVYRFRGKSVARLLNQILEQTQDPEIIRKTYELFKKSLNYSSAALTAMVRIHLIKNDFNKALEVFVEMAQEHKATPCKRDLMIHCLKNKDPENLQKIMDISTEIHGEMNSLFDLAVSCLESGKKKQAVKIFTSPGFRVKSKRVYDTLRQLLNYSNLKSAEEFVELTRDIYDVDQERLYAMLLEAYDRTSNASRALDLWNRMQEEDFYPGKRSLNMIANLLEKNKIPVPFQRSR